MRVSSLQLVFSLSTLFLLPNAVHARPIELNDFKRVPVNFERLAGDQLATIDEKSEGKNGGWGLGLIFKRADPRSANATAAGSGSTGSHPSAGGASANGRALGHRTGLMVSAEQRGLHLGALDSPGQPGLRLGALNPPGQPGLRLGTARESDNSSDLVVPESPQGENSVHAVPESSTMTLFGSSLVALFLVRLRQSPLF
jgi:hypothetical protein